MARTLYRLLLFLHPPAFRHRFAAEMLYAFDEVAPAKGASALLSDGLGSLLRQWLLRSGLWKLVLAILGACLQISAGGLVWLLFSPRTHPHPVAPNPSAISLEMLIPMTIAAVGTVIFVVTASTLWTANHSRKRIRKLRSAR